MDENENVKDHSCDPERIWEIRSRLGLFEEFGHPVDPEDAIYPDQDLHKLQIQNTMLQIQIVIFANKSITGQGTISKHSVDRPRYARSVGNMLSTSR